MQGVKVIGENYKVIRALFQVHNYLYAQVCSHRNNYEVQIAALYVYENEDPSQCLKMLREKLDIKQQEPSFLVFPYSHIKEKLNDKNISLFFIRDYIVPLKIHKHSFSVTEFLEILHGGLSSLNQLHMRDIIHGNIALNTCYLMKQAQDTRCRFVFNILDTTYFTEDDKSRDIEDLLFQSEGQNLGQRVSFKDDLESLVYVLTHLLAKSKLLTIQRFQLQWISETELLRWKNCDFFKEMIKVVPPGLEILIEIYSIAKSLRRNEKPDYLKLMKKVLGIMAADRKKVQKTIDKQPSLSVKKHSEEQKRQAINEKDINIQIDQNSLKNKRSRKTEKSVPVQQSQ